MKPIIEADRLSKRYQLGKDAGSEFWALRDVSFQIQRGDVVGLVGRNGAGKSTLLKVLSRITEPSAGRAVLRGRVASLLEVGTGFHPDLSGRENIFLNGAILGMRRQEIARKLDEIVAFSEIEKFIDTPVKRYSSGMYVRLAFAVAAHLEPEILVVDEVLAVGDAEFQRKCLGKMQEVSQGHGRTVFFVSHNMAAVRKLCTRAILLERGSVAIDGDTATVVSRYLSAGDAQASTDLRTHANRAPAIKPHFTSIEFADSSGVLKSSFGPGETVCLTLRLTCSAPILQPRISLGFTDPGGERIFAIANFLSDSSLERMQDEFAVTATFSMPPIFPSRYHVDIGLCDGDGKRIDELYSAATIEVAEVNYLRTTHPYFREMGYVMVPSNWSSKATTNSQEILAHAEHR